MTKRKRNSSTALDSRTTKRSRRSSSITKQIEIEDEETNMSKFYASGELAKYEAFASRVYRLLLNERASEAKVHKNIPLCLIPLIEGYKSVTDLKITDLLEREGLASILVMSYILCEDDLHKGNWGINNFGEIVKIDHDMSLWPLIVADRGKRQFQGDPVNNFRITARDIMNFPILEDAKPWYWPTEHRMLANPSHSYSFSDNAAFAKLKNNSKFIEEKYKYFLKAILFINKEELENIANKIFINDEARKNGVVTFLTDRIDTLRNVLIEMPEFRKYVLDHLEWGQEFANELTDEDQKKILETSYSIFVLECAVKQAEYLDTEMKDIAAKITDKNMKSVAEYNVNNIRANLLSFHATIRYNFKKEVNTETLLAVNEKREQCQDQIIGSLDVLDKILTEQKETKTLWKNKKDSIVFGIKTVFTAGIFLASRLRENWKREREICFFTKRPTSIMDKLKSEISKSLTTNYIPVMVN